MKREEIHARIEAIGIIPAVRLSSAEDALFAAEAVSRGGIPIVEIEMTVPGAIAVIAHLVKHAPENDRRRWRRFRFRRGPPVR